MSARKRLILHVGMPKTASSSLQMCLAGNREFLHERGWDYPVDTQRSAMPKHQSLVSQLMARPQPSVQKFVAEAGESNLILSTEGLTNHLYDFDRDGLQTFRQAVSNFEMDVFIVLRDPETWLRSYYSQAIFNPKMALDYYGTDLTLAEFRKLPRVSALLDYEILRRDLQERFEPGRIVVAEYESDWMARFEQMLGFELSKNAEYANRTAPAWAVEFMRQVNGMAVDELARNRVKSLIGDYTGTTQTVILNAARDLPNMAPSELDRELSSRVVPAENDLFILSEEVLTAFRSWMAAAAPRS